MNKKIRHVLFASIILMVFYMIVVFILGYKVKENKRLTEEPVVKSKAMISVKDIKLDYIEETKEAEESCNLVSLGEFELTAYCPCTICCGKWSGSPTASGTTPTPNRTIAVDINIIPFETEVIINNVSYIAEDTGSAIKGNKIDIYFSNHDEALEFGVQYAEVFIVKD